MSTLPWVVGKLYTRQGRGELWVTGNCGVVQRGASAHVLTSCGYVIEAHHVVESHGKTRVIWREAKATSDRERKASDEDEEDVR